MYDPFETDERNGESVYTWGQQDNRQQGSTQTGSAGQTNAGQNSAVQSGWQQDDLQMSFAQRTRAEQEGQSQGTWQQQSSYQQAASQGAHQQTTQQPAKKKKSGGVGKFFGIVFSGLLFGFCAGAVMIVLLRLFPASSASAAREDHLVKKPEVEIEKAEPIIPDQPDKKSAEEDSSVTEGAQATGKAEAESQDAKQETVQAQADSASDAGNAEVSESITGENLAVVTDVTKVVDAVMPSVVSIFGTYEVTENYWGFEMQRREDGSGSGIIVGENDEELLVVTNNHVVADSTSLSVQFIDNETYNAVVKGTDADADLAVIAVRMTELRDATKEKIRIATLGDSDTLKVGEPAIAIGNALGYGQSVTTGVISAVNRAYSQDEDGDSAMLIQTDAAINPGNSGGALLNIYGQVIGINSNKIGGMVIEGMGYAIPISTAKPILEELMSKKTRLPVDENQKGYLGISGINVTEDVRDTYGLPIGVYIAQVFDGTPAQRIGLKKGDIITAFDGEPVKTMEELSKLLDATSAGTEVELVVQVQVAPGSFYDEQVMYVTLEAQR
ncbi:MAG: trypsin-like peptidase domain-containing protein [Lachnospiraceae bacterium]|nr:trypsin-like peptidase domain-containing protein [Lachnospiraceae bacterium]